MKIPEIIKIGGHVYQVETDNNLDRNNNAHGLHIREELKIKVKVDGVAKTYTEEVFIHELLHVCFAQAGIDSEKEISMTEEEIVSALSPQLYSILKQNELIK